MSPSRVLPAILILCGLALASDAQAQQPKEPTDVERLKAEYDLKRHTTMQPLVARYQADLEVLMKRLVQKNDLDGATCVKKELEALKDTSGKEWKRDEKEPTELTRLRRECSARAVEAMRHVNTKYQSEFEFLARKLTQKSDLEGALAAKKAGEGLFSGGGTPEELAELRKAILGNTWSWKNSKKDRGVEMNFRKDGSVSHRGMQAKWKIISAHDVAITIPSNGDEMVLRFDSELKSYQAVSREFHGEIWK